MHVCQCLICNAQLNSYSILRQRISVVIGSSGTGKTNTHVHLVSAVHPSSTQHSTNVVSLEVRGRGWMGTKSGFNQKKMFHSSGTIRTPKIVIVALMNDAIIVIEHKLLQSIPVWEAQNNQFTRVQNCYKRLGMESKNKMDSPLLEQIIR